MKKKRTTITINQALYKKALGLMREEHFDDFSGFIEHLVREKARDSTPGGTPDYLQERNSTAKKPA